MSILDEMLFDKVREEDNLVYSIFLQNILMKKYLED